MTVSFEPNIKNASARDSETVRCELIGTPGSPYSVKLRAILRYRRIPFDWIIRAPQFEADPPPVRPLLVPLLRFPGEATYHIDTSPIAHALEVRYPGGRSIIPEDPALAFLNSLFEDLADEWITKMMYHYRWSYADNIAYCKSWIASDLHPEDDAKKRAQVAEMLAIRQIDRMEMVGCTPENGPVIEQGFGRVIAALTSHIAEGGPNYLFGTRPALADFAMFGQLLQLATDPVSAAIMRRDAQDLFDWLRRLDDASGVNGAWASSRDVLDWPVVRSLAQIAGDSYLPYLSANSAAFEAGQPSFEVQLGGQRFAQPVFGYQVKRFRRLRDAFSALQRDARGRVELLLRDTDCLQHIV